MNGFQYYSKKIDLLKSIGSEFLISVHWDLVFLQENAAIFSYL